MSITLPFDTAKRLQASVKRYVSENLDLDIGDLQASLFLDFCLKEIGPSIYNKAVSDAQAYFEARVSDLEGVCHEKEFNYWPPPGRTPTSR